MRTVITVLVYASLGVACGKSDAPPATPEPTAVPAPAAVEKPAPAEAAQPTAKAEGPAKSVVDDPKFELRLAPAGDYKAGELGNFMVSIAPRGEYHLNQEYPTSVEITTSEAVTYPKQTLAKADATEFGERSAKFDVPFTAKEPGEHTVQCNVRFAVCTAETCIPDERKLALAVTVK